MTEPEPTTFTCDWCDQTFIAGSTEEEVDAEAAAAFTPEELGGFPSILCELCWRDARAADPELDARYR